MTRLVVKVLVFIGLLDWTLSTPIRYTAEKNQNGWNIKPGDDGVAWASLDEQNNRTGWNTLNIQTNSMYEDWEQAYAAGFVEGYIGQKYIWWAWLNFANGTEYDVDDRVLDWVHQNWKWMNQMADSPSENDNYWFGVKLVIEQATGIYDGYNQYAPEDQQLTMDQFLLWQLYNDLDDIECAATMECDYPLSVTNMHCSALVKLTEDGQRLYYSHNTWAGYSSMLRFWRNTDFQFQDFPIKASTMSYSGAPGYIASGDDFYITNQNLVIMETTNAILDVALYKHTVPETVPYWIRVTVANWLASNGYEWTQLFALYNSGTYNNQWMIIDNKLFNPGQPLQPGTLWILEQIPGYIDSADKTDTLSEQGYWASYNIPYFPIIYNLSGYIAAYELYGSEFSYTECPRAKMFARGQENVKDLDTMKSIMRYNEYKTDPLSQQDACSAIAARCDLNAPWTVNPTDGYDAFGATDAKLTDNVSAKKMFSWAVCGPTWDSQPPFAWTNEWAGVPHYGHADVFAFNWEPMSMPF